jgi:hypothetical protein
MCEKLKMFLKFLKAKVPQDPEIFHFLPGLQRNFLHLLDRFAHHDIIK